MKAFFIFLAVFAIASTTIKLIKKDAWWIRMFDFPQAQITFIACVALGGIVAYADWQQWIYIVIVIALTGCIIYQLTIIIPYTFLFPVQTKKAGKDIDPANTLSLMVINVYQFNTEYERCLKVVKKQDADIVIAVETDDRWNEAFGNLKKEYTYHCEYPLDNTYGILLYSKLELKNTEIKFLVEEHVPSIHTHIKLKSGIEVALFCVHPQPPSPTENDRSTERDAELFIVGKKVKNLSKPVIVAGDLNDVAWSKTTSLFQKISGLLDPRVGRGFFNTYHAKYPIFRWPLDHIFHSDHFKLMDIHRLEKTGSDHFPIYAKFYCNYKNQDQQEVPEPDESDFDDANEKINKV